jgi:hypothetical protein
VSARQKKAEVVPLEPRLAAAGVVGRVASFAGGEVRVELPGPAGPVPARVAASLDDAALAAAARDHQEAVLLLEDGDPSRPILVALLRSRTPLVDAILAEPPADAQRVARVDGKRVVVEGKEEVVLQCGRASLTLRRDGKVVLRGVNVVSQAEQVHKVRGGKVQIN